MNEQWYIAWVSRLTGKEGRGLPMFASRATAQARCNQMNEQCPGFLHWPVPSLPEQKT